MKFSRPIRDLMILAALLLMTLVLPGSPMSGLERLCFIAELYAAGRWLLPHIHIEMEEQETGRQIDPKRRVYEKQQNSAA
jgi:hypothetical protein